MPKYVIEREIPGIGNSSPQDLQEIARKSCDVLNELGPRIEWLHSYVTDSKIYCVYMADDENVVREHARRGEFPADRVSEVKTIINPSTAEVA